MDFKKLLGILVVMPMLAGAAHAGDVEKGEKTFKRCKACHSITDNDGNKIVKGGKTGPNLYGVIGRTVGSEEGFIYGESIAAVGEAGTVWDEENLAIYVTDPEEWLEEMLGEDAKTKMTFKLKKGGEDIAAFLATMTPS